MGHLTRAPATLIRRSPGALELFADDPSVRPPSRLRFVRVPSGPWPSSPRSAGDYLLWNCSLERQSRGRCARLRLGPAAAAIAFVGCSPAVPALARALDAKRSTQPDAKRQRGRRPAARHLRRPEGRCGQHARQMGRRTPATAQPAPSPPRARSPPERVLPSSSERVARRTLAPPLQDGRRLGWRRGSCSCCRRSRSAATSTSATAPAASTTPTPASCPSPLPRCRAEGPIASPGRSTATPRNTPASSPPPHACSRLQELWVRNGTRCSSSRP